MGVSALACRRVGVSDGAMPMVLGRKTRRAGGFQRWHALGRGLKPARPSEITKLHCLARRVFRPTDRALHRHAAILPNAERQTRAGIIRAHQGSNE